jgi:ABC-2 type transport system permease protein
MTYRERVSLFWMFMFPVLLMLLLGAIFGRSGQADINLGVVDLDHSPVTEGIVSGLGSIEAFNIASGSEADQLQRLQDGKNNAVLVLEQGFFEAIQQGQPGRALIYVDESSPTVAGIAYSSISQVMSQISQEMARQYDPSLNVPELISVEQKSVTSNELSYVDFIVPGILALTLMQLGLMGLALNFVTVRERGILRRIKVSPVPLSRYLGSEITASLIMALLQSSLLLGIGWAVFRINLQGNPLNMIVVVLVGALSFQALGFFIASVSKTFKTAEMAASSINMPMMFLAGVFFPLSILPAFLATFAKFLPLYYLGHALREVMIRGAGLGAVWQDLLVLIGMAIASFALTLRYFRWE